MSLQAAYDQARQSLESNDLDRAIGLAQHILDAYPDNLEAYRILGEAYLANRQLDRAQESFERVLRSDPENIPAHVGLGITCERRNQLDRAIAEFEQALEIKPDMTELRSQLLRLYTEGWGSENAQLRLSRAGLARLYAKGHMLPQAISEFRQVLADQPGRHDAVVALAESLWRDGQDEEAIELGRTIIAERPESLKANLLLGYLLMTGGQPEGERYWQAAWRMDPYQAVAQALFETLPQVRESEPTIEEWDEAAWRSRRAAEQQEQIDATRPMEAITPAGIAAGTLGAERARAARPLPAPVVSAADADDFLASLLSLESPPLPPPPIVPVDLSGENLDLGIDMQPFSLDDLTGGAPAPEPQAAAAAQAEPDMTPFSLADLGLSDEEIAAIDQPSAAPAAQQPPSAEEPTMTPFSLADLGLSDEEIAGLDLGASTPQQDTTRPIEALPSDDMSGLTPFSLADLGLSPEEIAGLDMGAAAPQQADAPPSEEVSDLTPFSLADLGLSPEEIAGLESLQPESTPPAPRSYDTQVFPRDLVPPAPPAEDLSDLNDLPIDLQPFSIDELDLGSDSSTAGMGDLPASLQPFSLDEPPQPPAPRPRVSGFPGPESTENENVAEDEDFASENRGFSWQQASQKPQPDFTKTRRDESLSAEASIFAKLKHQHLNTPGPREPEPLPPVSVGDNEHLGLFSLDNVPLREEAETPAQQSPEAAAPEIENLEDALAAGQVQPFSLADLGLSPEEIAALEAGSPPTPPAPAAPEIENLEDALAAGQVQPFSLADLGLSDEEIAALGIGEPPAEPQPPIAAAAEPQAAAPAAPGMAKEPAPSEEESLLISDLKPFSLADLGLSDEEIGALGLGAVEPEDDGGEVGLGLTEEELEGLDGGDLQWGQSPPAQTPVPPRADLAPQTTSGDLVLDRLMALGRQQGYVDISDIMANFEDPEAETARIEAIGQQLHAASIEIRDGDEIIDMDADYEEGPAAEESPAWEAQPDTSEPRPAAPARDLDLAPDEAGREVPAEPATTGDLSDTRPFSLSELGLSDEEINSLGLGDISVPEQPGEAAAAPESPSDEPDMTPFSLSELGLSDDEIAALGLGQPSPQIEAPDMTPFSLGELGLSDDEINSLGLGDISVPEQPGEAPAPESPSDEPDMTPFSLSELGLSDDEIAALGLSGPASSGPPEDIVTLGLNEPAPPSAPATPPPAAEQPPLVEQTAPPPVAPVEPPARQAAKPPEPPPPARSPEPARPRANDRAAERAAEAARVTNTGNDVLDAFLRQLDIEPENDVLRLSVARVSGQIGQLDLALRQYKLLIKQSRLLEDVVDELHDLIAYNDDRQSLQRLHRALGDAYSKQGRLREAVDEYCWRM